MLSELTEAVISLLSKRKELNQPSCLCFYSTILHCWQHTEEQPPKRNFYQLKWECDGTEQKVITSVILSGMRQYRPWVCKWSNARCDCQGCCGITLLIATSMQTEKTPQQPHFQTAPNLKVPLALEKGWTWWPLEVPSDLNYFKVILQSSWLFIIKYLMEEWRHCQEAF